MIIGRRESLAIAYRPFQFRQMFGQSAAIKRLKTWLLAAPMDGRSVVIDGPPGVGKTSLARILAAGVLCRNLDPHSAEPCAACTTCQEILSGAFWRSTFSAATEFDCGLLSRRSDFEDLARSLHGERIFQETGVVIIERADLVSEENLPQFTEVISEQNVSIRCIVTTSRLEALPPRVHANCLVVSLTRLDTKAVEIHLRRIAELESALQVPVNGVAAIAKKSDGNMWAALGALQYALALKSGGVTDSAIDLGIEDYQGWDPGGRFPNHTREGYTLLYVRDGLLAGNPENAARAILGVRKDFPDYLPKFRERALSLLVSLLLPEGSQASGPRTSESVSTKLEREIRNAYVGSEETLQERAIQAIEKLALGRTLDQVSSEEDVERALMSALPLWRELPPL